MNTTRGSSEPVRLQVGRCRTEHGLRLHGKHASGSSSAESPPAGCAGAPHAPAQQQLQIAAVAGVVEEAGQVAAVGGIDVEPHRRCAAGQPLTQHL